RDLGDHQQPLRVRPRVRLGQVPQRVARLGLDASRIGIRDAHEDLVDARRCTAEIFQMAEMERLKAPVDHATGDAAHSTTTPEPSSTAPTRRTNRPLSMNSASSTGAFPRGSETTRPP